MVKLNLNVRVELPEEDYAKSTRRIKTDIIPKKSRLHYLSKMYHKNWLIKV